MKYINNQRCTMLDIKKAYKIATTNLFGFKKWIERNGLNELMDPESPSPIEETYLYDTFAKSFSDWIKENKLYDWEDIIDLIRKREKDGTV